MNTKSNKSALALTAALSVLLIHASGCSTQMAKSDAAAARDVAAAEGKARPASRIPEHHEKMLKAAWNGRLMEVVTLLEQHGVDPNVRSPHGVTPLSLAAQNNHINIARKLLEHGADPNIEDKRAGWFPLMWASFNGFDEFVMLLIEHGADVNKRNAHGETAMLHAAFEGRDGTVRILLDHGADYTVENDKGFTAMKAAKNKGFYRIVEMISAQKSQRDGG